MPFPDDPTLWPSIREERIQTLLGPAMARAGAEAWVVFARENANDPLAAHIGAENAGGLAAFLFFATPQGELSSIAISPSSESTALAEVSPLDTVIATPRGENVYTAAAAILAERNPATIAVNNSGRNVADGLSWTQRNAFEQALGPALTSRLVSSGDLVVEWLSVKLPREVDIMRRAAFGAMRPGATGWDVDRGQRAMLESNGSIPIPWSTGHPVGYWAHDLGPRLGGSNGGRPATGDANRALVVGQTFAFDGFFGWEIEDGATKTISVEEMVVVTVDGAEWLVPPQEEWVLVGG